MAAGARGPELGQDRVLIGHDLVQLYPVPSGWRARCECGEEFRGIREYVVTDAWYAHRDEEAQNRGLG